MLELNPSRDNFEIKLPLALISENLVDAFSALIRGRKLVHNTLLEYVAESVQSISVPDILGDILQITGNGYVMNKKPATNDLFRMSEQQITLKFRILDGMWNYWMFRLNYMSYVKENTELVDNVGNLALKFYTNDRRQSYTITFIKCVLGGIEGQEFNYGDETTDAQYFSWGMAYDDFTIDVDIEDFADTAPADLNGDGIIDVPVSGIINADHIVNIFFGSNSTNHGGIPNPII